MSKDNESWYWHNLNVATALILLVAMIALCSLLAPDRARCYDRALQSAGTGPAEKSNGLSK